MSSAASGTQSMNFIPQWLRSSSNSESTTNNTNNQKIPTTRLRYSKDEILALRSNLSPTLLKSIRQEIVKNLKEVEHICRPQVLNRSTLNRLSGDETTDFESFSNFVCGRTPPGATRTINNNNGQPQTDQRKFRENPAFPNRTRVADDREHPSVTNRRNQANNKNSSDDWRRQKTEDEENKEENFNSKSTRNGTSKRFERTKSDEKWNSNEHRSNSVNQFETSQNRAGSGWRKLGPINDRTAQPRRPPPPAEKEEIPEWMDETLDGDGQAGMATFEQDGTYIRAGTVQSGDDEKSTAKSSQSTSDEASSPTNMISMQTKEPVNSEKSTPPPADTPIVNIPNELKQTILQPSPTVQKCEPTWDEEFDHHDVATTVVESTLAEDNDESPPIALLIKGLSMANRPSPPAAANPSIKPVNPDDKIWFYKDPQNTVQGPFSSSDMERWYAAGYFTVNLPIKRLGDKEFSTIQQLSEQLGRLPFRTDNAVHLRQQQQNVPNTVLPRKNASSFGNLSSTSNNSFMNQYLAQQQSSRQHVQTSLPFNNRPTSMTLNTNDLKRASSQSQMHLHSPQSASMLLNTNPLNDPAIIYSQQRSLSSTNQQMSNSNSYEDNLRTFRQSTSQTNANNNGSFYSPNASSNVQQNNESILARLSQAAQLHNKQQQDKIEDQRRREFQQPNEVDLQQLRFYSQIEQERFKRQENDFRYKQDQVNSRGMMPDSMKKTKSVEIENFLYRQPQLQQTNEQTQIDAIKAENVRRYQQHYQELSQNSNLFQIQDGNHWTRHSSFPNEQSQFLDMQDSEQERRIREAASALLAHQNTNSKKTDEINDHLPSSDNKMNPWIQALLSGSSEFSSRQTLNGPETSSINEFNQEATEVVLSLLNIHPKTRSNPHSSTNSWNQQNSSYQDGFHRQQSMQNDIRPRISSMWDDHSQRTFPQSAGSNFWDHQYSSSSNKQGTSNSNNSSYVPILR